MADRSDRRRTTPSRPGPDSRSRVRLAGVVVAASLALAACSQAPPSALRLGSPSPAVAPTEPRSTPAASPTIVPAESVAATVPARLAPSPTPVPLPSPTAALPTPRATTTATGATLAPGVITAARAFRDALAAGHPLSPSQLAKAQEALATAATAFAASGGVGQTSLEEQVASALSPPGGGAATVLHADLDGDGRPEVLVAVPFAGLVPVLVPGGQTGARPLLASDTSDLSLDQLTRIHKILTLGGPGQTGVVVTRTSTGASATNLEILVLGWDGSEVKTLFDHHLSDWAGPIGWRLLSDNAIELRCPALGIYDHKLFDHPTQVLQYRWQNGAFVLAARQTGAPVARRQMMNLAEADFFADDLNRAILRYRSVIDEANLVDEPDLHVDWRNFARFRLGEIAALQGDLVAARTWLGPAASAPAPLGPIARAFLEAAASQGAPAGFAAVQRSPLPTLLSSGQAGNLDFPVTLGAFGALGKGAAAALDPIGAADQLTRQRVDAAFRQAGLAVTGLQVVDLDGDGQVEVAVILPFGSREQTLWLLVSHQRRWTAIASLEAPNGLGEPVSLPNHRQAIAIRGPAGTPGSLLGWDGQEVTIVDARGHRRATVPTNFAPPGADCVVAEDLP